MDGQDGLYGLCGLENTICLHFWFFNKEFDGIFLIMIVFGFLLLCSDAKKAEAFREALLKQAMLV